MSGVHGARIGLSGTATISDAEKVRSNLASALATSPDVVVACDVTDIDLSTLQLLIGADLEARRQGGGVSLAEAPSGALQALLGRAGFVADLGGAYATAPSRWAQGGRP